MGRIGCERPWGQSMVLPSSVYNVLVVLPTNWRAVIMKTEISEAISAYLIAATPEWWANFFTDLNIGLLQVPISGQLGCLLPESTQRIHIRLRQAGHE
jgi:hypothetical protein